MREKQGPLPINTDDPVNFLTDPRDVLWALRRYGVEPRSEPEQGRSSSRTKSELSAAKRPHEGTLGEAERDE